jgi:hypothetical protein
MFGKRKTTRSNVLGRLLRVTIFIRIIVAGACVIVFFQSLHLLYLSLKTMCCKKRGDEAQFVAVLQTSKSYEKYRIVRIVAFLRGAIVVTSPVWPWYQFMRQFSEMVR